MDLILVFVGLAILLASGDVLVRGAVALSLRMGVPALIVSLTIVAFGTSAPELLVSVKSALEGAPGIAFGNVVGSNIANVLLVLGIPAMISRIDGRDCDSRRSYGQMMVASLVFILLCFQGPLVWMHGLVLLSMLAYMLWDAYAAASRARNGIDVATDVADEQLEDADPDMARWKIAAYILVGIIGLPIGAHLLIDGARAIALEAGVSEAAIGLTLVALGTSLPELATTVVAAIRRQADVAIGNVIGSNIFNIVAIMGVASFFGPLAVPPSLLRVDLWVMLACAVVLAPYVLGHARMGRRVGIAFTLAYAVYVYAALALMA
jgi:cation:H+ antiporter